jgi:dihydrofolate synthase/folylpolyglutamate synthase
MLSHKHDFKAALTYLNKFQFHGFRLGLERITSILNALGNPEKNYPCLHVAGTNGKGSVSAIIASILHAAGYRTGLYTSPHLLSLI